MLLPLLWKRIFLKYILRGDGVMNIGILFLCFGVASLAISAAGIRGGGEKSIDHASVNYPVVDHIREL